MEKQENKLYTLHEVTDILQLSYPTVLNLIKSKKLRGIRIGAFWRVTPEDLNKFIQDRALKDE